MTILIDCVIVNLVDINNDKKLISQLDQEAIFIDNRKMQAMGYPNVVVYLIDCRWYVPVASELSTWLLLKFPNLKIGKINQYLA